MIKVVDIKKQFLEVPLIYKTFKQNIIEKKA